MREKREAMSAKGPINSVQEPDGDGQSEYTESDFSDAEGATEDVGCFTAGPEPSASSQLSVTLQAQPSPSLPGNVVESSEADADDEASTSDQLT